MLTFVEIIRGVQTEQIIPIGSLDHEISFSFSRSSGPGGQSVNKLNTKVELRFSIITSSVLYQDQKEILLKKLETKINLEGELLLTSQSSRSQLQNKQLVVQKFYEIINKALKRPKRRVKTKATRASMEKRIQNKKEHSEKKSRRNWNI